MTGDELVPADAHVLGDPDAPITIVEFGDLECPNCKAIAADLRSVVSQSQGQVRLVWRHFPLFQLHPHALTAALAAEAAGAQGEFWRMQETLFAHQDRLTGADLASYARRLGLDGDSVIGEPAQTFAPIVQRDYATGTDLGVEGTPTLFVAGRPYTDKVSLRAITRAAAE